jgi:hypothetical protein
LLITEVARTRRSYHMDSPRGEKMEVEEEIMVQRFKYPWMLRIGHWPVAPNFVR